ncbi:hypothetical protein [Chryseobacterium sp. Leaf405]|uniref:hypothetical protein n=1 Tax=Chryseobacterium sp. Leaf405 TaxID=1736367 RepID=UPI00103F1CA5|nr:hypothetical protein [Chryseobacterium sp. Leaf405]
MKVKLGQAVKMFFGISSLEMVYFEAISNALDAEATEINIDIIGLQKKISQHLEFRWKVLEKMNVKQDFKFHRALDDSKATALILQQILSEK